MVKESRKIIFVVLAIIALLAACAPLQSPAQVQGQIGTGVAMTVQAQNDMSTSVAQTLTAQAPLPTETETPTLASLGSSTGSETPGALTVTPFVVVPASGGTATTAPKYACSWREVKPSTNVFNAGEAFDVKWVITNTGNRKWPSKFDLDYVSGTKMSSFLGEELPPLDPGDTITVSFDATAPSQKGFYGMQFKVQGGLCWPALNVQVGQVRDP